MRIATWNVNSVRARLEHLLKWLEQCAPHVVCLQELKCEEEAFPWDALAEAGYEGVVCGQKAYNGVAILARGGVEDVRMGFAGDDDPQARFIEGWVRGEGGGMVHVMCAYAPNGNPISSDKFAYKLAWMDRLHAYVQELLVREEVFVLAGDMNVIPEEIDAHDPQAWVGDALFAPEVRARWRALLNEGLWDAHRQVGKGEGYTFWGYRSGAWRKGAGIRIDHMVLSPQAADRVEKCGVDRDTRGWERPSDHAPVWLEIAV